MNANQEIVIECPVTNQQSTEDSVNTDDENDVQSQREQVIIAKRRRICLFVSVIPLVMSGAALFTVLKLNPSNEKPTAIDLPTSLRGSDGDDDSFVEAYLNASGALNETLLPDGESTASTVNTSSFEDEESMNEDELSSTTSVATSTPGPKESVVADGTPSAISSTTSVFEYELHDLQSTTVTEEAFTTTMSTMHGESIDEVKSGNLSSTTAATPTVTSPSVQEESTGEDDSYDLSSTTAATAAILSSTSYNQSLIDSDDLQSTTVTTAAAASSVTYNQSVIEEVFDDLPSTTATATVTVVVASSSPEVNTSTGPFDSQYGCDDFSASTLATVEEAILTTSGMNEDESGELQSTTSTEPATTTTETETTTTAEADVTETSESPTCEDITTKRQCKDPSKDCVWFTPLNWKPLCFTKPEFSFKLCKEIRLSEDCVESAVGCEWLFEKKSGGKNTYDTCRFSYSSVTAATVLGAPSTTHEEAVSEDLTTDLTAPTSSELVTTTVETKTTTVETKATTTVGIVTTTSTSDSPTCEEAASETQCKGPSNDCVWFTPLNWKPLCLTKPDFALKSCKEIRLSEDCIKSPVECEWYFERYDACRFSQNEERRRRN